MRTTPKGTETVELPRKRNGLLKNAKRAAMPLFLVESLFPSSEVGSWRGFDMGAILEARLKRSMARCETCLVAGWEKRNQRTGG
jgi:hypothetical protein